MLNRIGALFLAAAFTLAAGAQEGNEGWNPAADWSDGRKAYWRLASDPSCKGSLIDVRFVNASRTSGYARLNRLRVSCAGGGEDMAPEAEIGQVEAGQEKVAELDACLCVGRTGVSDVLPIDISFARNGQGEYQTADGCTYKGGFADDQMSGPGVYACPTGYRMEGFFRDGKLDGQGKEVQPGVLTYVGDFSAGVREGAGKMTYADGSVYEGDFRRGRRDGVGRMQFANGAVYDGDWRDDKRSGQGVFTDPSSGWTYDGGWRDDRREGLGRFLLADGSYSFEGAFRNDVREGLGAARFSDGRVFRGEFSGDEQIGQGTVTFPDGRTVTGAFRDHRPHGFARDISTTQTVEGQWNDGVLEGEGTIVANGVRFTGRFAGGKRNGPGVTYNADGSSLECTYVDDVADMPCTRVLKNGKRIEFRSKK